MTDDEIVEMVRALPGLLPPASPEAVAEAEDAIGYRLPPLLRRLYLEGANGGFGPRSGVLGLAGSDYEHHGDWADIVEVYQAFNEEGGYPGLLWLYDWGCGIWSVLDCRDPAGPMWGWDPNGPPDADFSRLFPQNMTFAEWMTEALSGNLENAFGTSSLEGIAERRREPDESTATPSIDLGQPLSDAEILTAAGKHDSLPPPASAEEVLDAERAIGYPFPPLLRRLYLEVANGGFGPRRGILGVSGTSAPATDVVLLHEVHSTEGRRVPEGLLWLCDWGSAVWLLVDCRDGQASMWVWDPIGPYPRPKPPAPRSRQDSALFPLNMTLSQWLSAVLNSAFEDIPASKFRSIAGESRTSG